MAIGAIAKLLIKGGKYALKKYGKKAATKSKNKITEVSFKKRKNLKKIKPVKSTTPIKEVKQTKKVLQNQKVVKPTRSATEVKANHDVLKRAKVGHNLRTHSGGTSSEIGAIKKYIKARGILSPKGIEKTTGIPSSTGRLLKQKKVLKNQKVKDKK